MKTVITSSLSTHVWLFLFGLFLTGQAATAQNDAHFAQSANASAGYWKLVTNPTSRTTSIRFFDHADQLLYQETLNGQYVKLNKRTVRLFDSTLHQLVHQRLLAPQVRRHELLASNDSAPAFASYPVTEEMPALATEKDLALTPNLWIGNQGKLNVAFLNAAEERVSVTVLDAANQFLYNEKTWLYRYRRPINIASLPDGNYYVHINGSHRKFAYRLVINQANSHYRVEAIQ